MSLPRLQIGLPDGRDCCPFATTADAGEVPVVLIKDGPDREPDRKRLFVSGNPGAVSIDPLHEKGLACALFVAVPNPCGGRTNGRDQSVLIRNWK